MKLLEKPRDIKIVKRDFYLNGVKIDPKRIEFLYGGIYLDGIRLFQEEDWIPPAMIHCRCIIIPVMD